MLQSRRFWIAVSIFALATSSFAVTYIVPADRDLVQRADAIVVVSALDSHSELNERGGIVTIATVRVEQSLKGDGSTGQSIRIVEPGGFVGDRGLSIAGSPTFDAGKQYLLFLNQRSDGDWRTYALGLGKFDYNEDLGGRKILSRGGFDEAIFGFREGDLAPYVDKPRDAEKFQTFIKTVNAGGGAVARDDYFVDRQNLVLLTFPEFQPQATFVIKAQATRADYLLTDNPRWSSPSASWETVGTQPGYANGGRDAAASAASMWTNLGAGINYVLGGTTTKHAGLGGPSDNSNGILFNDPNGLVQSTRDSFHDQNIAAIGGSWYGGATHSLNGETFHTAFEGDVEVGTGLSTLGEALFAAVLGHELGHTLGFRHSDQNASSNGPCNPPLPCASPGQAMMATSVQAPALTPRTYDSNAANTVYGSGPPPCTPPRLTSASANPTSITAGNQTTLTAVATGTAPLSYQWYIGTPGNTSTPAGPAGATVNVFPSNTTSYWVRVTGQCAPPADSSAVTVTVTQPACVPTTQVVASSNQTTVTPGTTINVFANANGSNPSPTFQWFKGTPGSGTLINGATSSTLQDNPAVTTSYYVQASNSCSTGPATSNVITITVQACSAPTSVTAQASPTSIITGGSTTLAVSANGTAPYTIQWFSGNPPGLAIPSAANQPSFQTSPAVTTIYYAEVSNGCGGPIRSNLVTVTVSAACTVPSNAVATATPNAITSGQTASLGVTATGTGLTFQWFTGAPPNGNAILNATAATLPVTPAATTTYYARVTGQCGTPINSNPVTVTVTQACINPSITTHPASQSIIVGTKATLSVAAAGTAPLTYQWFQGATGDTSKPETGATAATFTTPALLTKTQYWVRVGGNCGQPVFSNTATVEPKAGRPRPVKH